MLQISNDLLRLRAKLIPGEITEAFAHVSSSHEPTEISETLNERA
jgi:hypothetical protein